MKDEYLQAMVDKFVLRVKTGYLYSEFGVWVAWDELRGVARLGLTDFRQQSSGDVAFVELPPLREPIAAGDDLATVETVKLDLTVPAPLAGEVVATNQALDKQPELINQDPYGAGWLVDVVPTTWPAVGLLDAEAYLEAMTRQAEAESKK